MLNSDRNDDQKDIYFDFWLSKFWIVAIVTVIFFIVSVILYFSVGDNTIGGMWASIVIETIWAGPLIITVLILALIFWYWITYEIGQKSYGKMTWMKSYAGSADTWWTDWKWFFIIPAMAYFAFTMVSLMDYEMNIRVGAAYNTEIANVNYHHFWNYMHYSWEAGMPAAIGVWALCEWVDNLTAHIKLWTSKQKFGQRAKPIKRSRTRTNRYSNSSTTSNWAASVTNKGDDSWTSRNVKPSSSVNISWKEPQDIKASTSASTSASTAAPKTYAEDVVASQPEKKGFMSKGNRAQKRSYKDVLKKKEKEQLPTLFEYISFSTWDKDCKGKYKDRWVNETEYNEDVKLAEEFNKLSNEDKFFKIK